MSQSTWQKLEDKEEEEEEVRTRDSMLTLPEEFNKPLLVLRQFCSRRYFINLSLQVCYLSILASLTSEQDKMTQTDSCVHVHHTYQQ